MTNMIQPTETAKPKFEVLMWQGTHFTCKFDQASFSNGYLNVWLEYSDVNAKQSEDRPKALFQALSSLR